MTDQHNQAETHTVAFVIEALTVGGAEQMLVAMANRFVEKGWSVHVICLTTAGELSTRLDPNVTLTVIGKKPGFDWRLPLRLRALLKEIDPVAVNCHLWTANLWTRVALPMARRCIIATEHSRDTWKPAHYRLIDRVLAHWTTRLVAVSTDTARFYTNDIGIPAHRVTVINNGIDTTRFSQGDGSRVRAEWADADTVLIGTVGRLVEAKNHARLIETAKLLDSDVDNFHVVIVGDGELQAQTRQAVEQNDVAHRVTLAGARSDIPDVLAALDIFVLSSDREGHPLTALEAQAAGTPAVLTDAGGSRDAIAQDAEGHGGIVVEKSATALAATLAEIVRDPARRNNMAHHAQRIALEQFDLDNMVNRYEAEFVANNPSTSAG